MTRHKLGRSGAAVAAALALGAIALAAAPAVPKAGSGATAPPNPAAITPTRSLDPPTPVPSGKPPDLAMLYTGGVVGFVEPCG